MFGVGLLVAAWLPFIPFAVYGADSRAAYAPFVGVVFVIAALMDAGAALARRGGPLLRPVRLATAAALACVLLGQAVMLVGVQEVMRGRHRLDMDEMRQLKELLPAPPDGTVFMPMRVRSLAAHTGDGAFDDAPPPALRTPWFAPPIVRWTYRKWRLFSGHAGPAKNWLIAGGDAQNLILTERLGFASKPRPDGMFDLPWGKVFPFEVDGRGRVLVISRVVFKRGGEFVAEARPRMAAALAEAGRVPERTFEVEVGKK